MQCIFCLKEVYEPVISTGDARSLSNIKDNSIDLICAHPPYANIIQYTDNKKDDLSFLDINDFLKEIEGKISRAQKEILQQQIKCCFYSSEIPLPQIVKYLKNEWKLDFIAWYGHSEMCVLASAHKNELDYFPFHTYGYVEAENSMLLGTSYHNFDMPLIRYNTDDLVSPKRYKNGVLKSFEVSEGRIFDFIYDKNNLKIAATALFRQGQFYQIYKYIEYIQVFQEKKGYATILITQNKVENLDVLSLMNLKNIDMDFDFIYLKKPVRTVTGKVPLRVLNLPENN